jgi:hypothetical protein
VLDAFIIEQIRKRDRQDADDRPTLSIPAPMQMPVPPGREREPEADQGSRPENDEGPRGVIVIDFA